MENINWLDIIFAIIEICIAIYFTIMHIEGKEFFFLLGGYHLGKGLYEKGEK